jgi:GNAT superfamily N-acetyltransferase
MELGPTSALLQAVFPASRVGDLEYLQWLYRGSPFGPVIEANLDDEHGRAAHYALVPISLARGGRAVPAALSLNTAVAERARGGGTFVRLAGDAIEAARQRGADTIVGVANANSTRGFVGRLGFELLGPLDASVLLPRPGSIRAVRSCWSDASAFAPGGVAADSAELLAAPSTGEARSWNEETLGWRLRRPGARYALHRGDRFLAVSCEQRRRGLRVAVLLKVFAAHTLSAGARRALVRAACRFHRAPVALHVGINRNVRFGGLPLPARLRDSPLNLIYLSLAHPPRSGAIVDFEFLDFDAF